MCFCVYAHLVCNVEQCRWGSGPEIGEVPESSRFSYFWNKVKSLLQNLCNWLKMAVFKKTWIGYLKKRNADQNTVKYLPIIGVNIAPAANFINDVTDPI